MTAEQVAKVLSSLGKRNVCFQNEDKICYYDAAEGFRVETLCNE